MKTFLLILSVLSAISIARGLFESKIKAKIEDLRQELKDNGTFSPFVFENKTLHIDNFGITGDINASGIIDGLLDFEITDLHFSFISGGGGYKLYDTVFTFPEITVSIDPYKLDGSMKLIEIFGEGLIRAKVTNLKIDVYIELSSIDKLLSVQLINLEFSVEEIEFEITGWLNEENRSKAISQLLTENGKIMLEVNKKAIGTAISGALFELVKDFKIPLSSITG